MFLKSSFSVYRKMGVWYALIMLAALFGVTAVVVWEKLVVAVSARLLSRAYWPIGV